MQRHVGVRAGFLAAGAFLLFAHMASAQSTTDPTKVQFTPSSAHNDTLPDGSPVVSYYELELYMSGATAPFQTANLGKPTPDATNTITVDLSSVFMGWPVPGQTYFADVAAVGPNGTAASTPSNTFTFTTQCAATVSPTTQAAPASGTSASASITAASSCGWSAVSNDSWITITSAASGTDSGTLTYSVAPNTTTTARTGSITVAGQAVTITQDAAASTCSYSVTPTFLRIPLGGATATVNVAAPAGCSWTAQSNSQWITIANGASGTGSGAVTISVTASGNSRSGSLVVAGTTVTVRQRRRY